MCNVKKKREYTRRSGLRIHTCPHSEPFRVKLYLAMYITGHVHTRHSSVASGGRVSATHPKLGEGWAFGLSAVSPATRGQCRGRLCHWFTIWGRQCSHLQWTGGGVSRKLKVDPERLNLPAAIFKIASFSAKQMLASKIKQQEKKYSVCVRVSMCERRRDRERINQPRLHTIFNLNTFVQLEVSKLTCK